MTEPQVRLVFFIGFFLGGLAMDLLHKLNAWTKRKLQSERGNYSCATCGVGRKEPCEHWQKYVQARATSLAVTNKEEWLKRYKQAFMDFGKASEAEANEYVKATDFEHAIEGYENDPEGAAHEEMSYWES